MLDSARTANRLRISIVIPVLNEAVRLQRCLNQVRALPDIDEVIVVDGGSDDASVAIAQSVAGVRVLCAERGRAQQMNAGAQVASGDVLLFLHADVCLPDDAAQWVRQTLADDATVAGAFRTWTVDDRSEGKRAPWLHLADLRSRYSRLPYGDQAMFVRSQEFHKLGGFSEIPLMEDLELSSRLKKRGRIRTVTARVRVSGRRFLSRPVYYTVLVNLYPLLFRLGVSPRALKTLYGEVR